MTVPRAFPIHAIGMAASTGGPVALRQVLADFAAEGDAACLPPVFITQHLPHAFTGLLAAQLAQDARLPCAEAAQGEPVRPGRIYLAPGDYHMTVAASERGHVIKLLQTPPLHFCRPAADPMLESLAVAYGKNTLAVILTGMGTDGCTGCDKIKAAGGTVFVQDAASSAVWGMPGHVAEAGLADRVIALSAMGRAIRRRLGDTGNHAP
jgi:two-component system chemotaxis response regulator CheB